MTIKTVHTSYDMSTKFHTYTHRLKCEVKIRSHKLGNNTMTRLTTLIALKSMDHQYMRPITFIKISPITKFIRNIFRITYCDLTVTCYDNKCWPKISLIVRYGFYEVTNHGSIPSKTVVTQNIDARDNRICMIAARTIP